MNESIAETQRLLQQIHRAARRWNPDRHAASGRQMGTNSGYRFHLGTRTPSRPVEFPHPTTVLVPNEAESPRAKGTPKATHKPGKGVDRDCVPGPY